MIRHLISFRLRSTAWSANLGGSVRYLHIKLSPWSYLAGSSIGARSATRLASFPALFLSHPTACGRPSDSTADATEMTPFLLAEPERKQRTLIVDKL